MDFVNDYKTKMKLAQQLRARQQAMLNADIDTGPIVTQGQGAAPTQVQANPWGALAKLGTAYFAGQAGKNATAAEQEANDARMQALQGIMGQGAGAQGAGNAPGQPAGFGGAQQQLTPEKALQLQDLGVDAGLVKAMMPKADALGAMAQAANTRQGRAFLVAAGKMTKEQKDSIDAEELAGEEEKLKAKKTEYLFEQANKTFAPTQGRAPSELEFAMAHPEEYAAAMKAKNAGKGANSPYEKKAAEEQAKQDVALVGGESKLQRGLDTVNKFIEENKKKPYTSGATYRAMDQLPLRDGQKLSSFQPEVQIQEQAIKQFQLDALEQMRGFGQVTEKEQDIIGKTQFDIYDSPSARTQKLQRIKEATEAGLRKIAAAKERLRTGNRPAAAGADLDSEIDSLMGN